MSILLRLRPLLEAPRLPLGLALVAVLLCAPSLRLGLQVDDHYLRLALSDPPLSPQWSRSPMTLFGFFDGEATVRHARETGVAPWWTSPAFGWPSSVPSRA
jgi:hypothetical protein